MLIVDRKSTRLNSSHVAISYAVFCLHVAPPSSSLFPYTTLFRSDSDDGECRLVAGRDLPRSERSEVGTPRWFEFKPCLDAGRNSFRATLRRSTPSRPAGHGGCSS